MEDKVNGPDGTTKYVEVEDNVEIFKDPLYLALTNAGADEKLAVNAVTRNSLFNPKLATKDDLNRFATKDELNKFATKEDLNRFATKEDLNRFATKEDLNRFATKEDLNRFATKEDLNKFATKEYLNVTGSRLEAKIKTEIVGQTKWIAGIMITMFVGLAAWISLVT